jgi:uncharacterized protein
VSATRCANTSLRSVRNDIVINFPAHLLIDNSEFEWIVSTEILAEYKEVLNRKKFKLIDEVKAEWFEIIDTFSTIINVNVEIDFPIDRKDANFLTCVMAVDADFLITGDLDFTEAQTLEDV